MSAQGGCLALALPVLTQSRSRHRHRRRFVAGHSAAARNWSRKSINMCKLQTTTAQPFVWTATADSIFAKVQRLCERISGTGH
jgi:hypothetical protein